MNPVLFVIDVQKDFFDIDAKTTQSLNEAVEVINNAIKFFRERHFPIISIQHKEEEDNLVPGRKGVDLPDELDIRNDDLNIHKIYQNAFNKTELESELRKLDADLLILTGFCAEYCVLSTYRGAKDLDFKPILLHGALASGSQKYIRFVESVSEVVSLQALKYLLAD